MPHSRHKTLKLPVCRANNTNSSLRSITVFCSQGMTAAPSNAWSTAAFIPLVRPKNRYLCPFIPVTHVSSLYIIFACGASSVTAACYVAAACSLRPQRIIRHHSLLRSPPSVGYADSVPPKREPECFPCRWAEAMNQTHTRAKKQIARWRSVCVVGAGRPPQVSCGRCCWWVFWRRR